jgi:hypothetical protein
MHGRRPPRPPAVSRAACGSTNRLPQVRRTTRAVDPRDQPGAGPRTTAACTASASSTPVRTSGRGCSRWNDTRVRPVGAEVDGWTPSPQSMRNGIGPPGLAGQLDHVAGPAGQLGGRLRVDLGDGQHPGALLELLDQAVEGLVELAVGQDPWAQAEDVVAQVADDPVQLLDGVLEAAAELGVAGQQGRACRPIPTANSAWMAPSCSSLAMRSRSSSTARRCSFPCRRAYSRATAACSAKISTSCTSVSRSSAPPLRLATVRVPRVRPRTARGAAGRLGGRADPAGGPGAGPGQAGRGPRPCDPRRPAAGRRQGVPGPGMARTHAGDWRDPERVRGWAAEVAAALQAVGGGPGPGQGSRRPARPSR